MLTQRESPWCWGIFLPQLSCPTYTCTAWGLGRLLLPSASPTGAFLLGDQVWLQYDWWWLPVLAVLGGTGSPSEGTPSHHMALSSKGLFLPCPHLPTDLGRKTNTLGAPELRGQGRSTGTTAEAEAAVICSWGLLNCHLSWLGWCPWMSFTEESEITQPCTDATFARKRP